MFEKQSFAGFKLGVLENFVNSTGKHLCWSLFLIKAYGPATLLKETSTQVFSCESCKIFKNTFFTEQLQWLLLKFKSYFQRKLEQKPVRLPAINIKFSWKKVFAATKIQEQPPYVFCKGRPATLFERGSSITKFLRTSILKNTCDRLLQRISTSVTNLPRGGNSWFFLSF